MAIIKDPQMTYIASNNQNMLQSFIIFKPGNKDLIYEKEGFSINSLKTHF
jgi:hypothetical protein